MGCSSCACKQPTGLPPFSIGIIKLYWVYFYHLLQFPCEKLPWRKFNLDPIHTYTDIVENGDFCLPSTWIWLFRSPKTLSRLQTVEFWKRRLIVIIVFVRTGKDGGFRIRCCVMPYIERACVRTIYRRGLAFKHRFWLFVWTGKYDSRMLRVDADFIIYGEKKSSMIFENIGIRVEGALEYYYYCWRIPSEGWHPYSSTLAQVRMCLSFIIGCIRNTRPVTGILRSLPCLK